MAVITPVGAEDDQDTVAGSRRALFRRSEIALGLRNGRVQRVIDLGGAGVLVSGPRGGVFVQLREGARDVVGYVRSELRHRRLHVGAVVLSDDRVHLCELLSDRTLVEG